MECPYANVTLALSCCFFLLGFTAFLILARVALQTRPLHKKTHKLFLGFVIVYSLAELLDSAFWTARYANVADCVAPTTENSDALLLLAHLLPDAFFISALSTTIHTIARLYHVVALEQFAFFRLFSIFLWVMNVALYCITFSWTILELQASHYEPEDSFGDIFVGTTAAVELSVSLTLLLYSGLLVRLFPNTMRVLFWMSFVCAFSLCLKAVLRIIPYQYQFQWWHPLSFAAFSFATQLVPIALMLLLEARGTHRIFANTAFPSYGSHMFSQDSPGSVDCAQPLFVPGKSADPGSPRRGFMWSLPSKIDREGSELFTLQSGDCTLRMLIILCCDVACFWFNSGDRLEAHTHRDTHPHIETHTHKLALTRPVTHRRVAIGSQQIFPHFWFCAAGIYRRSRGFALEHLLEQLTGQMEQRPSANLAIERRKNKK